MHSTRQGRVTQAKLNGDTKRLYTNRRTCVLKLSFLILVLVDKDEVDTRLSIEDNIIIQVEF